MKIGDIRDIGRDDILSAAGLVTKPTTSEKLLGSLGIFSVGLLVGAAAALLLAPQSGQDLRQDLGERLKDLRDGASLPDHDGESTHQVAGGTEASRDKAHT